MLASFIYCIYLKCIWKHADWPMCHLIEYREGLCCSLWWNPKGGHEMGSFSHKVSPAGEWLYHSTECECCCSSQKLNLIFTFALQFIFLKMLTLCILNLCCVGVLKQAPELGFWPFTAHWPRHGHGEHTALCWLQQTEYNTRRKYQTLGKA